MGKWIGVSPARLLSMSSSSSSSPISTVETRTDDSLTVELVGSLGEELMIGFVSSDYAMNVIMCNVTETGRIIASNNGCIANA